VSPSISVIIPAFNCAQFLGAAIESILHQTLLPTEVIVVNDGSSDNTHEVVSHFSSRIIYCEQNNQGVSAARNRGLDMATGEFVCFLDADDVAAPTRLERQWHKLSTVPEVVACFSGYWTIDEEDGPSPKTCCTVGWPDSMHRGKLGLLEAVQALTYDIPLPMTVMFRNGRGEFTRFPSGVSIGEDVLFCAMLRTLGSFVYIPEPLYGYRLRADSASQTLTQIASFQQRLAWLLETRERVCPEYSPEEVVASTWNTLAEMTKTYYWSRRRDRFISLRNYIRRHWPTNLPACSVARWKWYPDWMWNAKQRLDALRISHKRCETSTR